MQKGDGQPQWTGKSHGGYWGHKSFAVLLRFGMFPAYFLLVFVAAFFVIFRKKYTSGGAEYLGRLFGKKAGAVSWKMYRLVFSFGMSIIDRVAFFCGNGKIKCADGCEETIEKLISDGKGLIVLTAHVGGWQIAGSQLYKYGREVGIVGADNEDEKISELLDGGRVVDTPKVLGDAADTFSMLPAFSLLRRGGIVAMHGDRYAGGRFAKTEFLGGKVRAPLAAYVLAAKAGVPVAQISCVRESLFNYRMEVLDVFDFSPVPPSELIGAAEKCAKKFFGNLEKALRESPYQWYNFYNFWE